MTFTKKIDEWKQSVARFFFVSPVYLMLNVYT